MSSGHPRTRAARDRAPTRPGPPTPRAGREPPRRWTRAAGPTAPGAQFGRRPATPPRRARRRTRARRDPAVGSTTGVARLRSAARRRCWASPLAAGRARCAARPALGRARAGHPGAQDRRGAIYAEPQPEQPIAADGWFSLLGLGFGRARRARPVVPAAPAARPGRVARRGARRPRRGAGGLAGGPADRSGHLRPAAGRPPRPGRPSPNPPTCGPAGSTGSRRAAGAARQPAAAGVRRGGDVHPARRLVAVAGAAPGAIRAPAVGPTS